MANLLEIRYSIISKNNIIDVDDVDCDDDDVDDERP